MKLMTGDFVVVQLCSIASILLTNIFAEQQQSAMPIPTATDDKKSPNLAVPPPLSPYKFNERVGQRLIYGDIMLSPKQLKMRRLLLNHVSSESEGSDEDSADQKEEEEEQKGRRPLAPIKHIAIKQRHNNRWPDNEIPFVFSPKFSERQFHFAKILKEAVREALSVLEANSCFRFVARDLQRDFLYFDMREGCFSFVGKIGGRQLLSLAAGCLHDYIIWHEVMHALGLEHEHQRPDRDKYIEIQWENVEPGKEVNFDKIKWADVDLYHTYDYHSLMHYDGTAFGRLNSKNRRPMTTMRPLQLDVELSDNFELTPLDVEKLQILSNCDPNRLKLRPDSGLGPKCSDRSTNCESLASRGFCAEIRYLRLIRIQCQRTCGFCLERIIEQQIGQKIGQNAAGNVGNGVAEEDQQRPETIVIGQPKTVEAEEEEDELDEEGEENPTEKSRESSEQQPGVDPHYKRWSYPSRKQHLSEANDGREHYGPWDSES